MKLEVGNDELLEVIKQAVREVISETLSPNKKYLTRKDVAEMCDVTIMTVNNWSTKKILNPQKIGNRVLFDASEVDEAIKSGKILKYQHLLEQQSKL